MEEGATLPDEVLQIIFAKLNLKNIIRTSILSRRLRYHWINIAPRSLIKEESRYPAFFDSKDFEEFKLRTELLLEEDDERILIMNCNYTDNPADLDKWVFFSIRYHAVSLKINNARITTEVPLHSFKNLELTDCDVPHAIYLFNLEKLVLTNCSFENNSSPFDVVIHTPKLKELRLTNNDFYSTGLIYRGFFLIAYDIRRLELVGYPFFEYDFTGINILRDVCLDVWLGKPNEVSAEAMANKVHRFTNLLQGVTNARCLKLQAPAFQVFHELKELITKEYVFKTLKTLKVSIQEASQYELFFLKHVLEGANNLEELIIEMSTNDETYVNLESFGSKISAVKVGVQVFIKSTQSKTAELLGYAGKF